MKNYILEGIGTFLLAFVVALSLTSVFPVSTPVLAGVVLLFCAYTIGSSTGSHINPAITLGMFSVGKISVKDATGYIIAQMIAGFLAWVIIRFATHAVILVPVEMSLPVFLGEMAGALFFGFGIASIVYEKVHTAFDGVVAGVALFLGIAISAMIGSNGIINPAVAVGVQSVNILYIVAPIVGVIIGFQAVKALHQRSRV